jgi:CheY-like chemotaxis protein
MIMPHKRMPHILLVEDEDQVYLTLQRRLANEGYHVTLATTYEAAVEQLRSAHFHLAIFDVRLVAADESDQSGLRLLEELDQLGLRDVLPCIIMTAYGTMPMALHALQDLSAARFIPKEPYYITKLLDAIREVLGEYEISFNLEYLYHTQQAIEQGAEYIWAHEPDWPVPDRLVPEIEDLLGSLFYGARQLWIRRNYRGLSGSFVLEAHSTWAEGVGQSKIVKIGRHDKTRTEQLNYQHHVEPYLPAQHATQLNSAYTRHLGALLYTLFGVEAEDTVDFETYYQRHAPAEILLSLRRLFNGTCQRWYQNRIPPGYENLRDLYFDTFNLRHQPARLFNEIRSIRPDYQQNARTIAFPELDLELPNPLHWLDNDAATVMPVCRSITHGDLHAGNILMNNAGDCWLIDFYRTEQSHILRDFVELETDIKFRLLEHLPVQEFCQFEEVLVGLEHPQQLFTLPSELSAGTQKAAHVIIGLRAEAWGLLETTQRDPRLIQREYLTSLLMGTLNILRLRHFKQDPGLQPRREWALLSAAMMCQLLQ